MNALLGIVCAAVHIVGQRNARIFLTAHTHHRVRRRIGCQKKKMGKV